MLLPKLSNPKIDNEITKSINSLAENIYGGNYQLRSAAWIEIPDASLLNSWVWYNNASGAYATPAYMKDADGFVHLKGMIKNGTVDANCFVLPEEYRVAKSSIFAVASNGAFGEVYIFNDGGIQPTTPCNNAWVSLDGIIFKAT